MLNSCLCSKWSKGFLLLVVLAAVLFQFPDPFSNRRTRF